MHDQPESFSHKLELEVSPYERQESEVSQAIEIVKFGNLKRAVAVDDTRLTCPSLSLSHLEDVLLEYCLNLASMDAKVKWYVLTIQ